jgi:hypothetical protein
VYFDFVVSMLVANRVDARFVRGGTKKLKKKIISADFINFHFTISNFKTQQ